MKHSFFTFAALFIILPVVAYAGHPSVPEGATSEGSGSTSVAYFDEGVYQLLYSNQGGLVGSGLKVGDTITGISLRLDSGAPAFTGKFFDRFDIRLGAGKSNIVMNFANNFGGSVTQARTGSLSLPAGSMPSGSSPNSFGPVIKFDTPHVYDGLNLLVEVRVESNGGTLALDVVNTVNSKAATISLTGDADATSGVTDVGPAWAIAFEVTRAGKPTLTSVNVPNGASVDGDRYGNGFGTNTEQFLLPEGLLSNLNPGDQICGFCLRLEASTLGTGSATLGRFDVKLGRSAANFQTTNGALFANNFAAAPTVGRSGPLTLMLPTSATSPNPFGSFIAFDAPLTYEGGDLVMEWRTTSSNRFIVFDLFSLGEQAIALGNADATVVAGSGAGAIPAIQFKVIKPSTATPSTAAFANAANAANAALRTSLNNKIKKLKKKIKKLKKAGNSSKAKKLSGKLKKLKQQLARL